MAGLIDWSAINPAPAQPSQALASIPEMLQQFAQRRQKAAEDEQARKQAEAHFQAQMAEKAADDARAEQYHKDELDYQNRTLAGSEAQRRAVAEEGQRKDAAAAYPQIQQLNATDPLQARNLAMLHGGSIEDRPQAPPPAAPPPLWGLPRELGLAMNMGTGDTPQAPVPAPPPPGQQLHLAGRVLELPSAQEMETNRAAQAKQRAQQFAAQVAPSMSSPYAKQALQETLGMIQAPTWDPKEDPFKAFQARMQHLEDQQVTREGHQSTQALAGSAMALRERAADRQDESLEERKINNWKSGVDWKSLVNNNRSLRNALGNIETKGPDAVMSHKDAFLQLERFAKGGVPSEGEQRLFLDKMGGIPGALDRFLAESSTGDFSDITKKNIVFAAKQSRSEWRAQVQDALKGAQETFGDSPSAMRKIKGLFRGQGVDIEALAKPAAPALAPADEDRMKKAGF